MLLIFSILETLLCSEMTINEDHLGPNKLDFEITGSKFFFLSLSPVQHESEQKSRVSLIKQTLMVMYVTRAVTMTWYLQFICLGVAKVTCF